MNPISRKEILARYDPPKVPGWTCLQRAFGESWRTAENIARHLGYEVTLRGGPSTWYYVPSDAVGEINATFQRWAAEHADKRRVGEQHVSCRFLAMYLHFDAALFATAAGIPLKAPSSENEHFVPIEDLPLILDAARGTVPQGINWVTGPDAADRCRAWIEAHGLAGLTEREARRQKKLPSGS